MPKVTQVPRLQSPGFANLSFLIWHVWPSSVALDFLSKSSHAVSQSAVLGPGFTGNAASGPTCCWGICMPTGFRVTYVHTHVCPESGGS
jgi:hypothetical protein